MFRNEKNKKVWLIKNAANQCRDIVRFQREYIKYEIKSIKTEYISTIKSKQSHRREFSYGVIVYKI